MPIVHFTIVLTGVIGSGKSQTGNFFKEEDVFEAKWSLTPVTTAPASCTISVEGKCIKLVDTPGFLDPSSLTKVEEFMGLANAIINMPNGINAVGLVINVGNRFSAADEELLGRFLAVEEMIPYTFLILTHAKALGETDDEQKKVIQDTLEDPDKCPRILGNALSHINNRYMLLETVEPMEHMYRDKKSKELLEILQEITKQNKSAFTCALNDIANQLEKFNDHDKEELVKALTKDLQTISEEMKKTEGNFQTKLFWKNIVYYIAGGVGLGVGAGIVGAGVIFPSAIAAATSSVFQFLSRNPQIMEPFTRAMADIMSNYFSR